jgi:hypothetical protein
MEEHVMHNDYPKERVNALDSNENMVCFFCKKPVKEINDKLEAHAPDCKYRLKKQAKN